MWQTGNLCSQNSSYKRTVQHVFSKSNLIVGFPIKATYYSCAAQNVELQPLVKSGKSVCDKNNISVKVNSGNEIIKHVCKTNKFNLMDNSKYK